MSADDLREARELIIREHARAIRGKALRHLARVGWEHLLDGSLPRRIVKKVKG